MFLETGSLPKAVKKLLILNAGVYILLRISGLYDWGIQWLGLIPIEVTRHAQVWRLCTYLFVHANIFWHLIFNVFAIWMFGPEIERRMGTPRFIFYYLLTGIGGGVCSLIFTTNSGMLTIGANASIFGLLVAFAMLFPDAVITLIFPPVSLKAKHFVIGFAVIEALLLFERPSGVDLAVNLGAAVIGFLYIKYYLLSGPPLNWQLLKEKLKRKKKEQKERLMKKEIDPILDKISKVGMNGLTRKERRALKKAHRNM